MPAPAGTGTEPTKTLRGMELQTVALRPGGRTRRRLCLLAGVRHPLPPQGRSRPGRRGGTWPRSTRPSAVSRAVSPAPGPFSWSPRTMGWWTRRPPDGSIWSRCRDCWTALALLPAGDGRQVSCFVRPGRVGRFPRRVGPASGRSVRVHHRRGAAGERAPRAGPTPSPLCGAEWATTFSWPGTTTPFRLRLPRPRPGSTRATTADCRPKRCMYRSTPCACDARRSSTRAPHRPGIPGFPGCVKTPLLRQRRANPSFPRKAGIQGAVGGA